MFLPHLFRLKEMVMKRENLCVFVLTVHKPVGNIKILKNPEKIL